MRAKRPNSLISYERVAQSRFLYFWDMRLVTKAAPRLNLAVA